MKNLALAVLLIASGTAFAEERIGDHMQVISEEDRDMNAAIERARSTLDKFLVAARNPPAGSGGFKLKVMVTDEHGTEHFWFTPFKETSKGFAGVLANTPGLVKSVTEGKVYAFTRDQISDWGYELNGKQVGSYTVCVLFKKMSKDDVARYKRDYGFVCES